MQSEVSRSDWIRRINPLKPDNGCNSPEETIKKIDSSIQIKRHFTVIPENLSKDDFT